MEPFTLLLCTALAVVSVLLLFKYGAKRRRFVAMIDRLPGPRSYPLFGTALELAMTPKHRIMDVASRHSELYSPIYRMWTGPIAEVHMTRPECYEAILCGMKHIEKGWSYKFLHPWLGQGLLTSSGSKWHSRRKIITPTFHFQILETFCDVFVENSQILLKKLQIEADIHQDKGFDLYPFITRCALDMICETAMGVKIQAQEVIHSEYVRAVHDISELILRRGMYPWLYNDFIFSLTQMGRRYNHCLKVLHGFTKKVIQDRKAENLKRPKKEGEPYKDDDRAFGAKKRMAFLDLLLEASCDGQGLKDEEVEEEVDTFMFEGHDTTTAAISWTLYVLGAYPDIQEKVFEELARIFEGSDRAVTARDCQEMKYLERVIKETLRLFPSVPFIIRTLDGEIQSGGYTLPDGAMVVIHIYQAHRSPEHFPNPEQFDPDNFLPERVQGRHPYAYIPFSAGPRNCIGQKFAMLEEKIVLATILRRFKLRSLEKREDIALTADLILRPMSGLKAVVTKR